MDRLVPGHIAMHCSNPICKAADMLRSAADRSFASFDCSAFGLPREASSMMTPPAAKANKTGTGCINRASIQSSSSGPSRAAGRKAMKQLRAS